MGTIDRQRVNAHRLNQLQLAGRRGVNLILPTVLDSNVWNKKKHKKNKDNVEK